MTEEVVVVFGHCRYNVTKRVCICLPERSQHDKDSWDRKAGLDQKAESERSVPEQ